MINCSKITCIIVNSTKITDKKDKITLYWITNRSANKSNCKVVENTNINGRFLT